MHCQALNAKKCGYFFHQEIGFNPQNSGRNKSDQVFGHAINIDGLEQIFFFSRTLLCVYIVCPSPIQTSAGPSTMKLWESQSVACRIASCVIFQLDYTAKIKSNPKQRSTMLKLYVDSKMFLPRLAGEKFIYCGVMFF